ncbi:MAG TPA: hypothetical protein VE465_13940 [Streptosporangiaceae bacterium]|jgi:hypothetical protein|nr:hypothetical protein [Streptosporangiaceae bacterium]
MSTAAHTIDLLAALKRELLKVRAEQLAELWTAGGLPDTALAGLLADARPDLAPDDRMGLWTDYVDALDEWRAEPGPALNAHAAVGVALNALIGGAR